MKYFIEFLKKYNSFIYCFRDENEFQLSFESLTFYIQKNNSSQESKDKIQNKIAIYQSKQFEKNQFIYKNYLPIKYISNIVFDYDI